MLGNLPSVKAIIKYKQPSEVFYFSLLTDAFLIFCRNCQCRKLVEVWFSFSHCTHDLVCFSSALLTTQTLCSFAARYVRCTVISGSVCIANTALLNLCHHLPIPITLILSTGWVQKYFPTSQFFNPWYWKQFFNAQLFSVLFHAFIACAELMFPKVPGRVVNAQTICVFKIMVCT